MTSGALIWLIIFALSTTCFFIVAAIVAVKGSADLKSLLRDTKASNQDELETAVGSRQSKL